MTTTANFLKFLGIPSLVLLFSVGSLTAGPQGEEGSAVPQIARDYVVRMQEMVKRADDAALRAAQLMGEGDFEQAVEQYRAAIDLLPEAQVTALRRRTYIKQYARAATSLARSYADAARYNDAMTLIEDVLRPTIAPDSLEAKTLLAQLNDPEYYSAALTPAHLDRVKKVKQALKTGNGYRAYGDFDRAEREYHKVLNIDRYNSAARRSLEKIERDRMNYYDVARDHTRSHFLRRVDEEWEMPVPTLVDPPKIGDGPGSTIIDIQTNEQKLREIIIPNLEFSDTPLSEALAFLQQKSRDLDFKTTDPGKKGVNIILNTSGIGGAVPAPAAPVGGDDGFGFEGGGGGLPAAGLGGGVGDTPISLQLSQVPLGVALRYTTDLAQLKYKVESHAVVVVPVSTPDSEMFTNTYTVPPSFLSGGQADGGVGGGGGLDPFATPADDGGGSALKRLTAREVLEQNAGVTFDQGATAIFQPATSTLIVKNTPDNLELVEIYIEAIRGQVSKQIFITSKFIEISEQVGEELGFDWMLGAFNFGDTPRVFGSGGTTGNLPGTGNAADFTFINPAFGSPVGINPVTSALRSGTRAIDTNSIDALIAEANGGITNTNNSAPAVFGIAGVFTDPQFQMVIRALNQKKGTDLLSAPSVLARPGERAKIEVIREFIYPTEYDEPQIPNSTGIGGGLQGQGVAQNAQVGGSFPVTPANPAAFETRNVGVTLEVEPILGADDYTIDLQLAPEVVEFDGFINYGSPITTPGINGLGQIQNIVITENRIEMPIFNTRRVSTSVTIWDGQTVALGGLIREDIQDVEDKIPFIGDLPVLGRLFRSNVELHLKRNLTIFVNAKLVDPAGQRLNNPLEDEDPNYIDPDRPRIARPPVSQFPPFGGGGAGNVGTAGAFPQFQK